VDAEHALPFLTGDYLMKLKEPTITPLADTYLDGRYQEIESAVLGAVTRGQSLLVFNDRNTGKSITAASLLAPYLKGLVLSVHSHGGGTGDYLVPAVSVTEADLPAFGAILAQIRQNLIVDVSCSMVRAFKAYVSASPAILRAFDVFVIPVREGTYGEHAAIRAIEWLLATGAAPERVRVVFNEVERGRKVADQFPLILQFISKNPALINVSVECVLPRAELFDRSYRHYSIPGLFEETIKSETALQEAMRGNADPGVREELLDRAIALGRLRALAPQLARSFAALKLKWPTPAIQKT
jgi:hypothetical protein